MAGFSQLDTSRKLPMLTTKLLPAKTQKHKLKYDSSRRGRWKAVLLDAMEEKKYITIKK